MRIFSWIVLLFFALNTQVSAALIEPHSSVAVMDFGTHPGAVPIEIDVMNAGLVAGEYVTVELIQSGKLDVVDRTLVEDTIRTEGLKTVGLVDPDAARRLGEILHVRYIIYGNVNDVTLSNVGASVLSNGVTVCTVQAHVIMRIMDVTTGDILSASKGTGKSKSSFVRVRGGPVVTIEVGRSKVTQDSVHNALEQSAFQAVDILLERLGL